VVLSIVTRNIMLPTFAILPTHIFALGAVGLQIAVVIALLSRITLGMWAPEPLLSFVRRWALWLAAAIAVAALVLSLWYSEVVGLLPCTLCWFIRTMVYPLAFMLPIAAWRRDTEIWRYVLPLAAVGSLISSYQHLMQMGVISGGACHALSGTVDCAIRYIYEFGYMTFPLLGLTAFVAIALLVWIVRGDEV